MAPGNDAFATPYLLDDSDPDASAESVWDEATVEAGEPDRWDFDDGSFLLYKGTLWWSWVGRNAEATLDVGTGVSTRTTVYTGDSLDALTLVAQAGRQVMWTAEAGVTYRIQTAALSEDVSGSIVMALSLVLGPPPPPPPPEDSSTSTDTDDLAGGRTRVGTGENLTIVPVLPVPAGLTVARMQVIAQQMPNPVLKNGVPT